MKYGYNSDATYEMLDKIINKSRFGTEVGLFNANAYAPMMRRKTYNEADEIAIAWMKEMLEEMENSLKEKKKV